MIDKIHPMNVIKRTQIKQLNFMKNSLKHVYQSYKIKIIIEKRYKHVGVLRLEAATFTCYYPKLKDVKSMKSELKHF